MNCRKKRNSLRSLSQLEFARGGNMRGQCQPNWYRNRSWQMFWNLLEILCSYTIPLRASPRKEEERDTKGKGSPLTPMDIECIALGSPLLRLVGPQRCNLIPPEPRPNRDRGCFCGMHSRSSLPLPPPPQWRQRCHIAARSSRIFLRHACAIVLALTLRLPSRPPPPANLDPPAYFFLDCAGREESARVSQGETRQDTSIETGARGVPWLWVVVGGEAKRSAE